MKKVNMKNVIALIDRCVVVEVSNWNDFFRKKLIKMLCDLIKLILRCYIKLSAV